MDCVTVIVKRVYITNSICYEIHQKAKDILEGRKIDSTFYPVIYGADEDDDWTDPGVWKKANPSLGVNVGIDKVEAACESAKQNPGEENAFHQLRLNQWVKQGYLMTTEGNVVHYGFIEKFIERLGERFNIREIVFDRWGAVQMVQNLEGMGFTMVPFGQGFKDMSPPTKELMKLTLEKKLAHGGHPVLRWMMDNIYIRNEPAGNIKADKEKSTEKIDGAIATIMGLDRAIRCGNHVTSSVYDERGILFI